MGELFPVVYSPSNPDNWCFAPSQAPPMKPDQGWEGGVA
jgi:hypothetical protein